MIFFKKRKDVNPISWEKVRASKSIKLYAGTITRPDDFVGYIGLSLKKSNETHLIHDVREPLPLEDNCVDVYQSEDVFEHVEAEKVTWILNEVFRVLKVGGYLRLALPDYGCDLLKKRCLYDSDGHIVYDPGGGGLLKGNKVLNGGHLWFPTYEIVKNIVEESNFKVANFYHYYRNGKSFTNPIDHSLGSVLRTPDFDIRVQKPYRALSLVLDLVKE